MMTYPRDYKPGMAAQEARARDLMTPKLTSEERMLLQMLSTVAHVEDNDTIPCRVLINTGLADRFAGDGGWSCLRITALGRTFLECSPAVAA